MQKNIPNELRHSSSFDFGCFINSLSNSEKQNTTFHRFWDSNISYYRTLYPKTNIRNLELDFIATQRQLNIELKQTAK